MHSAPTGSERCLDTSPLLFDFQPGSGSHWAVVMLLFSYLTKPPSAFAAVLVSPRLCFCASTASSCEPRYLCPLSKGFLRSGGTRRSESLFSNLGNAWSQPVSLRSGLSPTVNLRRAFTMWQKHKRTLCSEQAPMSPVRCRSRPFARPRFSLT